LTTLPASFGRLEKLEQLTLWKNRLPPPLRDLAKGSGFRTLMAYLRNLEEPRRNH